MNESCPSTQFRNAGEYHMALYAQLLVQLLPRSRIHHRRLKVIDIDRLGDYRRGTLIEAIARVVPSIYSYNHQQFPSVSSGSPMVLAFCAWQPRGRELFGSFLLKAVCLLSSSYSINLLTVCITYWLLHYWNYPSIRCISHHTQNAEAARSHRILIRIQTRPHLTHIQIQQQCPDSLSLRLNLQARPSAAPALHHLCVPQLSSTKTTSLLSAVRDATPSLMLLQVPMPPLPKPQ